MNNCCNQDCYQSRTCPQRLRAGEVAHADPQPDGKPLELAHDVLMRGQRRSMKARIKRAVRSFWRYLTGPSPW